MEDWDDVNGEYIKTVLHVDSLRDIVNDKKAIEKHKNLTERFYAAQTLNYLVRFNLMNPMVKQFTTDYDFDLEYGIFNISL